MYCADSSFIIDVLEGEPGALRQADELRTASAPVTIPAPVVTEVLIGGLARRGRYLVKAEELLGSVEVVPIDRASASEAAHISLQLRRTGKSIGITDLLIAAAARSRRATLITRDADFGAIPGLTVLRY